MAEQSLNALDKLEIEEAERALAEFEEAGTDVEESEGRFTVTGISTLNWAFRKLAAIGKQAAEVKALAKEEKARIEAWEAKELKGIEDKEKFFRFLVEEYAEKRRAADPKFKKETTPYGEVSFKKQQPDWTFPAESEVVEFCLTHDLEALVKVETIQKVENKTQFKKAFDIKTNVISKVGDVFNEEGELTVRHGEVIDTVDENGVGTLYTLHYHSEEDGGGMSILDNESGELVKDVMFHDTAVVERISELVVPGVKAEYRPDKIEATPAK